MVCTNVQDQHLRRLGQRRVAQFASRGHVENSGESQSGKASWPAKMGSRREWSRSDLSTRGTIVGARFACVDRLECFWLGCALRQEQPAQRLGSMLTSSHGSTYDEVQANTATYDEVQAKRPKGKSWCKRRWLCLVVVRAHAVAMEV